MALLPRVEYKLNDKIRLILNFNFSIENNSSKGINIGMSYGYRLSLLNELKI
jgi:hypothetical protein